MVTVSIMQSNFLPSCRYFDKMSKVDLFVYLDDVKLSSHSYTRRVMWGDGAWIHAPLRMGSHGGNIMDAYLAHQLPYYRNKLARRLAYNSKNERLVVDLQNLFDQSPGMTLAAFNISCIERLADWLRIGTKTVRSSSLDAKGCKGEKLINICKAVGADKFLSGPGAFTYAGIDAFKEAGVKLVRHEYEGSDVSAWSRAIQGEKL